MSVNFRNFSVTHEKLKSSVHAHVVYTHFTKIFFVNIEQFATFFQRKNFPVYSRYMYLYIIMFVTI